MEKLDLLTHNVNTFSNEIIKGNILKELIENEKPDLEIKAKAIIGQRGFFTIKDTLNKDRYKIFIKVENGNIFINKSGKEFLKILETLEKSLKEAKQEYQEYIQPIEIFETEVKNEQAAI